MLAGGKHTLTNRLPRDGKPVPYGRKLAQIKDAGNTVIASYTYDAASGMRLSKTVGDLEYKYYYAGDKLMRMTVSDGTVMDFIYGSAGEPYAVKYNGTVYYYILNLQGDVVRIVNSAGTSFGIYKYDAWGNVLYQTNSNLIKYNPLRYRGYVYDEETKFYYLSSRYYDPEIGRFINADDVSFLGADGTPLSYNLFAYCKNNPVMGIDPIGYFSWKNVFHVAAIVSVAALAVVAVVASGGTAAPPLLAAASALMGTTVTATTAATAAASVAVAGVATMGVAATASILETSSKNKLNSSQSNEYGGGSTYNKDGNKIHYEYNGNGSGNVHLHSPKGKTVIWRLANGAETVYTVSRTVQKIINTPPVKKAISRAIEYVLSLAGMK